jgi:hypothetical protein
LPISGFPILGGTVLYSALELYITVVLRVMIPFVKIPLGGKKKEN